MDFCYDSRYIIFVNNNYYVAKYTGYSYGNYKFKAVSPTSDELYNYSSSYDLCTKGVGRTLKIDDSDIESAYITEI